MQDDVDVDPTYADRSKVNFLCIIRTIAVNLSDIDFQGAEPHWIPSQQNDDQMVTLPIRTTNLGPISVRQLQC